MILSDQPARDRFAHETGRNFSVIAPAGVGKTTAIAQRVRELARADARAREQAKANNTAWPAARLPKLVVVTYTRKAADEMRDRARRELVEAGLPATVLGLFNEAFFGTIHSFCFELLRRFGPLEGLPTRFAVEQDDAVLRLAFQRDTPDVAAFLPVAARAAWRRYGEAGMIWPLVWKWPAGAQPPPEPQRCPEVRLAALMDFKRKKKNARAEENIRQARVRLRRWQEAGGEARALGVPAVAGGGEEFVALWAETFQPLREWLAACAGCAAAQLAEEYGYYKEKSGRLGYNDLVRPVLRLLRDPVIGARIRAEEFSVLLDEAQDTDPAQFAMLTGVAQPAGPPGLWLEGAGAPPAPGRYSMVGDPQQSIYQRDLRRCYEDLRARLERTDAAEALTFSVTMRCDEAIVAHVNRRFPEILHGRDGQAKFVELQARPDAGPGGVWRLLVARPADLPDKANVEQLYRAEAAALAAWLLAAGPAGTGAEDWSQVAVLAPRKKWLGVLAVELRKAGLRAQLHADNRARGGDPARTWLAALLGVLADPADDFETIGVLREIFGVSDEEIYHWRKGSPAPNARAAKQLLEKLARAVAILPVRDATARAVAAVKLPERLAAIGASGPALEALLDQATLADARGENLAAFARALGRGPAEASEPVAQQGEIQLLSNHKAKGLEWPVVIHFGLFHKLRMPPTEYPCWDETSAPHEPPSCLLDKFQAATGEEEDDGDGGGVDRERANYERLLYVAATRPKQTLLLVDATALATGKSAVGSLADVLGVLPGGPERTWWESIPTLAGKMPKGKRAPAKEQAVAIPPARWPGGPGVELNFLAVATAAKDFMRRVRPSTLAKHPEKATAERAEPDLAAPPDYPEEQPPPAAAVSYGNWWHGVMERTPWTKGREAWAEFLGKECAAAPNPERARLETARLLASPLAARLAESGWEFAVEMPFLWAEGEGKSAFDGCMDLAAWNEKNSRWLVVDWKTDFVAGDYAVELAKRYGPQVGVYARALAAMTGAQVEAVLYGTRVGVEVEVGN